MQPITIGVLQPMSNILPASKDFELGLKEGFNNVKDAPKIEIVKEYIGTGDPVSVEKAVDKLLNFDDVSIVTGILSNKIIDKIAPKFKDTKRVLLVNNLGGHVPNVPALNNQISINSVHLWRHAYTIGYWAVKNIGKKGMFLGSVYDAGYSFSQMFYAGMMAADPDSKWSFSIPPMRQPQQPTEMDVMFPYLEQYQPDFVFAAFCGAETTQFLNEMIKRGWHKKTKITGLPYLLEPYKPVDDDLIIYSTIPFLKKPLIKANRAFYYLGEQSGEAIARALVSGNTDVAAIIAENTNFFNLSSAATENEGLMITEHTITRGETSFSSKNIAACVSFPLNIELMRPLTQGIVTGWLNPYLCV